MKDQNYRPNQVCTYLLTALGVVFLLSSCVEKSDSETTTEIGVIPLPDDLTKIQSTHLEPILDMLGDAQLIAMTEGSHFANEPLDFRNELVKFLVKEKRIDVVAFESGVIESRHLFEYVNGKDGDIDQILTQGLSWNFHKLPQNRKLIEWLRDYNIDTTNLHKVKLYGFDIPGSPLNPMVERKINTAITTALTYLKEVDVTAWEEYENRLKPFMSHIHINYFDPNDSTSHYMELDKSQRNELTGIVNDLIKVYELNEIRYTNSSSKEDYNWAYRSAICSRQIDNWLRTTPMNYRTPVSFSEVISSNWFWDLHHVRDRAMADNIEWIKSREGDAKMFLFGHIIHLSKSTLTIRQENPSFNITRDKLGQYLALKYQDDYKVIGHNYIYNTNKTHTTQVDDNALANLLGGETSINYYRSISGDDKQNLNKEWKIGEGFQDARIYMNPYQAVDVLFFTETQTEVVVN